jgi:hypothetical protein
MRPVCILALVTAVLGLAGTAAAARLRIESPRPLTLAGRGFEAGEVVKLVVKTRAVSRTAQVRAGADGTFRRTFPGLAVNRCLGTLKVSAVGSRGSRVSFTLEQLACNDD